MALARRLAGILFALWRDGTTFSGARGAPPARVRCGVRRHDEDARMTWTRVAA